MDAAARVLRREGREVPVSPRAFNLLLILLERRPGAVSKQELLDRLWPGTFVSDGSLPNLVAEVRAAVGDDPRKPRRVRTLHRFGYAFPGEVEGSSQGDVESLEVTRAYLCWRSREFVLVEGENLIGRGRDCGIQIDAATVSRHHAKIVLKSGDAALEDLGSKNGTFLAGNAVGERVALCDGDEIQLGSVRATYGRRPLDFDAHIQGQFQVARWGSGLVGQRERVCPHELEKRLMTGG